MEKDFLKRELLLECFEDYVGLWRFPWDVREVLGLTDSDEVKSVALEILRELILSGKIIAGDLIEGEFCSWETSPEETFARIEATWNELGREPAMLKIAWFTTPCDEAIS